jgi:signal transduction histidine kinase
MLRALLERPRALIRRLNLWPRLAIASSLGLTVMLGVLGLLILRVVDDSRDRILEERLVIAELAARQVDSVIEHDFAELQAAGASAELQNANPASPQMQQALVRLRDNTGEGWLALYLLDGNGALLAAAPSGRTADTLTPEFLAAAREAVTNVSHAVTEPYTDPAGAAPAAALMVPFNGLGAASLVLAGVIDLSRADLSGVLNDARGLGKTGHAELFDDRGLVIASTDPVPFLAPGEHRQMYVRDRTAGMEDVETVPMEPRSESERHREAEQHIMAVGLLSSAPWGIAIGGSKAETLAPVTDLRNEMLLLGAATLVALWVITLIGARLLVRPVRVITAAADGIASGDLATPIGVGEGGEIGRLGEMLETMRVKLKASLEEIEERDRNLELRVEERTREVQTLLQELRRKEEIRTRLLASVISAQEEERSRIARELHDETGQALTGIIMSLEAAVEALDAGSSRARERLERALDLAGQSVKDIRHLVADLRPAALDDLGLVPALRAFAESRLTEKGIQLKMETSGLKRRLPPPVETCLFRVLQEAVTNIVRHSGASSARISLRHEDGEVHLLVVDDGIGFDPAEVMSSPDRTRALGLAGMQERMSLIGGRVAIDSLPGGGTRVEATLRLEPEAAPA